MSLKRAINTVLRIKDNDEVKSQKRLKTHIDPKDVSEDFAQMCSLNQFMTLADIVQYPVRDLMKKPGFSMRVYMELVEIIQKDKLDRYLKDE